MTEDTNKIAGVDATSEEALFESHNESDVINDNGNDHPEITVEDDTGGMPPNKSLEDPFTTTISKREQEFVKSSRRTRRKSLIDSIIKNKRFAGLSLRSSNREYAIVVGVGLCLAVSAGFSNGVFMGGFLNHQEEQGGSVHSVAGVTGTYTRSAIFLAKGEFHKMGIDIGIILSVMFGSFLAGFINPRPVAFELGPRLGLSFVITSCLLTLGAIFATWPFISVRNNGTLEIYFTAMANGLQNGLTSLYSAHLIRTTHLTGTTTNIGLLIGQSFRGNRTNEWKLWILTGLATSFWSGSLLGYYASRPVTGSGLALVANAVFIFLIAVLLIAYFVVVHKISILEAVLGIGRFGSASTKLKRIHIHKETTGKDNVSESCRLLQMFDDLDKSGLGLVNQDVVLLELAKMHKHMQQRSSRRNLRSLMADLCIHKNVDSDNDWKVSGEQWAAMVESNSEHRRFSASVVGPAVIRNQQAAGLECEQREEQSSKIDVER